jgi:predicted Zn finger-like uncharacterized protein
MFSRCPSCNAQQLITTQQLRETRGLVTCDVCRVSFDALPTLTERMDETLVTAEQVISPLTHTASPASSLVWGTGSLLMLILLLGQLIYFQGADLMRYPQVYSSVYTVCQLAECKVPAYRNLAAWSVSHSDLQAQLNHSYWLTAALTNQAELAQTLPVLKFSLTDYKGQTVVERLLAPQQYSKTIRASANQTVAVRIPLILPATMGGFTLSPI